MCTITYNLQNGIPVKSKQVTFIEHFATYQFSYHVYREYNIQQLE